jgi:hypothetical protein
LQRGIRAEIARHVHVTRHMCVMGTAAQRAARAV